MKNFRERRKYVRIEAKIKVAFRSVDDLVQEYTRNISTGGIFLRTDQLIDPNAEIELSMTFPSGMGEFMVKGRVMRQMSVTHPTDKNKQLYGVGIRFINPDPKMIEAIEQAVAEADHILP